MDEDCMLPRAVFGVIAALLIIALAWFIMSDAPRENAPADRGTLAVDVNNTAEMHRYGMPTKADVMEWHMTGQWGYKTANSFYVYADLPGDKSAWDELYGIDPNPNFDK